MIFPPFCPNNCCQNFHRPGKNWYVKNGSYYSRRAGKTQVYKCKSCGKRFSSETFSLDYHTQIKISYRFLMQNIYTSSGIRDLSRLMKVSCSTILNRISRLSRQMLAVSHTLSREIQLKEDLVADGFESFVKSQYMPNNINILVGKDSQFWFMSDYSQLSRKGRMTPAQKEKNKKIKSVVSIGRNTIYDSFTNIIRKALDLQASSEKVLSVLYTDEHKQYQKVMSTLSFKERLVLRHARICSRLARTVRNPLF